MTKSDKERMANANKKANELFQQVKDGLLSTAEFARRTGRRVRVAGKIELSKYTRNDLRSIRARNGVGNPPRGHLTAQDKQINAMHDAWHAKKFGGANG